MAKKRKVKIVPLKSENFEVHIIKERELVNGGMPRGLIVSWFVRNRVTLADTQQSENLEEYADLKRVWRKSKENFDSACRFMAFNDLFSTAGIEL